MSAQKYLAVVSIIAFLVVGAFGIGYAGVLMGHGDMGMDGCSMMGHDAALCDMSPIIHMSSWQTLFAAIVIPSMLVSLILSVVLVALTRWRAALRVRASSPQLLRGVFRRPEVSLYGPLRHFIARGLLHPKIF